ncbi:MAG TPA: PDZ domain-containing protein [Pirellulaceae bacterium]|nr:PDZ domain-containing protein [Pirellulaceae bacterium]
MSRPSIHWLARYVGAGLAAMLLAVPGWSQVPRVTEPLKDTAQGAADAAKQAAPKAGSSVKEAAGQARDAAKSAAGEAREEGKRVGDAAKGAADDARRAGEDTVKGARREGREAVREGREGVREGREALREGAREGREAVREGVREGREVSAENLRAADLGLWFDSSATAEGLVIADIAAQGAISKIGFQEGDRIVSINDTAVRSEAEFTRLLLADDIRNERARVVVFRGGREQVLYVQPALIYQDVVAYDPLWQYGLMIDDRYADRIVIQRVYPRTPAYYAGLRAGDVVTTLAGRPLRTVADFTRALSSADGRLALQVNRANQARQISLDTSTVTEGRTRATLRPEIDAEGRVEGRTEGRTETRLEGRTEGKAKGRLETEPSQDGDDVPTPRPRLEKQPKSDKPGTDTPRSEKPSTATPRSEKPGTDTPRAEKPDVEIPDVPAPATKAPGTPKGSAAPGAPAVPKTPKVPSVPKL